MRAVQALIVAALLLLVGFAAFLAWSSRLAIAPISPPPRSAFGEADIARGAGLAGIGACAVCHTAPGGRALAGGLPIETPFGAVSSANITPDPKTGIGAWSEAAFVRAMRQGVDRRGRRLYPAFPYEHFARVDARDLAALYAWLMTREPVEAKARPNRLMFPLGFRPFVALWDALFLKPRPVPADPRRGVEWNRGAYLTAGLGHCAACHAPRNALGAETAGGDLSGGRAEGWDAPALDAASPAPVPWTTDTLYAYLRGQPAPGHTPAAGPMRPVARSLAEAPEAEVRAIAVYIASLQTGRPAAPAEPAAARAETKSAARGAVIFAGACAGCHANGALLTTSTDLAAPDPRNAARIVLRGTPWEAGTRQPFMPPFAASLSNRQVADVLSYVRARYGGRAPWPNLEAAVTDARRQGGAP